MVLPRAFATGGAFPDTTHGGGTVDNVKADGVDRALSGDQDIDPWYFKSSETSEAGEYASAECNHCHEPHNLFGAIEPPPTMSSGGDYAGIDDDTDPDAYLLFGENRNDLCWYCHNHLTVSAGGPFEEGYGRWGIYQGDEIFSDSSHGKSSDFLWPGVGGRDSPEVWPRAYVRQIGDENKCINCHTPHGVKGAYDSGDTPASGNYDAVTAAQTDVIDRQLIAREEALCLTCHDSTGPAVTDIKASVDKYLVAAGTGHPVREYYGRHNLAGFDDNADSAPDNEVPEDIEAGYMMDTAGSFHAECVDCHNPHVAMGYGSDAASYPSPWRGTVFQPSGTTVFHDNRIAATDDDGIAPDGVYLGPTNAGTWGVEVDTATGEIYGALEEDLKDFTDADPNYLYELCLKCHSAWAWDSSYTGPTAGASGNWNSGIVSPTSAETGWNDLMPVDFPLTDVAVEFATNNPAYHPVFAVGKNRPELSGTRNPNWCAEDGDSYTADSLGSTCRPAVGDRKDLINATGTVEGTIIYFEQTLSQTFVPPWRHTSLVTCVDCHEDSDESAPRGPHGSSRPFILRSLDRNISYTVCGDDSGSSETACGGTDVTQYYSDTADIDVTDATIFCLNCHRADVYYLWTSADPPYNYLSRMPHPPAGQKNQEGIFNGAYGSAPRDGIACMGCHGGGGTIGGGTVSDGQVCDDDSTKTTCKLGNIHGHPDIFDLRSGAISSRLIIPGANWGSDWSSATTSGGASCATAPDLGNQWTNCANSQRGGYSANATYNY